jgi:hypothetical protein
VLFCSADVTNTQKRKELKEKDIKKKLKATAMKKKEEIHIGVLKGTRRGLKREAIM